MADATISRETVEAAARVLVEATIGAKWESLQPSAQYRWAVRTKAALGAAVPLIEAAAFDRVKAEVEELAAHRDAVGDDDYEPSEDDGDCCEDAGECHRSGAMASYARVIALLSKHSVDLRAQS